MESKLFELDQHLEYLIRELKRHEIFEKINMIITSDHGMETIKGKENAIFLDNYVNTSLFEAYGSSAVYDLFLKNGEFLFFS
jgi:predicted AlkP superfamily pyrophosphatase or phosphodiesterase